MQRFIDENKPVKCQRKSTPLINAKKESPSPKPSVLKKSTIKPSPLPTTRKSWPSPQPPKAKEASPFRTNRKPLSTSADVKSKTLKSTPSPDVANRNLKKMEKKQATVTKRIKSTKTKVNETEAKPSFYNKVTKKNSVVPLETKPFLRKGSGIKAKEASRSSETPIQSEENDEVVVITNDVTETLDVGPEVVKCEEHVSPERVELSEVKESVISPTAWVEVEVEVEENNNVEENNEEEMISSPVLTLTVSPVKVVMPAGVTSPRVRHSLSQMLLKDSSEGDVGEWGNAEHPPALVYEKESPKGFKRLLNTKKGKRSFFSLSTFRGSKTNESKLS